MNGDSSGDTILLAIDDHLLPLRRDLCYYLTKPTVREEPVLSPSDDDPEAPDHQVANFYGTVLFDEGRYRMWYHARRKVGEDGLACYAESADGIHWTKPDLGQVEFRGSRANNIVALGGQELYGVSVIKDELDPDPDRRYKMIYEHKPDDPRNIARFGRMHLTLRAATSPDGVRWTTVPGYPVDDHCEHGSFYRHQGLYVAHAHGHSYGEGGGNVQGRQGLTWVSPDFDNWVQGLALGFLLPVPADPSARGYWKRQDQVHLGVGAASLGNVCVGVAGIWREQGREEGPPGAPPIVETNKDTFCDFNLLVSNDGIHFREPVKGHVFLSSEESPAPPVEGHSFPTILCQGNGIVNVGEETRLYHGRWRHVAFTQRPEVRQYYRAEVALATFRRDGWGALGLIPNVPEGWVWSAPVTLPEGGCRISLNGDHPEQMQVEVSDDQFRLLPEYSGDNAGTARPDRGIESTVAWPGEDLSALGGKSVRLRVHLRKTGEAEPRLYTVCVRSRR